MDEKKAIGSFKLRIANVLKPFNMYGLGSEIPRAIEEIVQSALVLHERLNGNDVPYKTNLREGD